jgi:hypothetical protein
VSDIQAADPLSHVPTKEELPTGESNFVKHARRELELIGEDQSTIDKVLNVMAAVGEMGLSGGSHGYVVSMLTELMQFHPLSPITNNPDEWIHIAGDIWGEEGGIWQNTRDSQLFSADGGKTYWSLADGSRSGDIKKTYTAKVSLR